MNNAFLGSAVRTLKKVNMHQLISWYQYNINIMNEGKTFAIAELAIKLYCSDLHIVVLSLEDDTKPVNCLRVDYN